MELYDVMHTTCSARQFTDDPLPDETLVTILDHARFAPSGGNRQGWRVIVVRDRATKEALAALSAPAAKRYAAQVQAGENPWNTIDRTRVDAATIERLTAALGKATGKDVEVKTVVDPTVIGGVVARVGDVVIDGTVSHRLLQLRETLNKR